MNSAYMQVLQASPHFPSDVTDRLFPYTLVPLIDDLYKSTRLPLELIFNTVLATLSLSCQSLVDVVHPHTNMPEPCSLYLLAIAEPGAGKTTINRLVMNPCYEFADRLIQQYEERNKDYKTELQIWNTRQKALAANLRKAVNRGYPGEQEEEALRNHERNKPTRPVRPNFIYEDVSLKALVEGLNEHPEAGVISDEAVTFFRSYLKNYPGLLNKAWSGQPFDFGWADEKYHITPRLTFSLMSQPDVFTNYINKNDVLARGSGFLSRFLFSQAGSTSRVRDYTTGEFGAIPTLAEFHKKINGFLSSHNINSPGMSTTERKTLKLSKKALGEWQENQIKIESKALAGGRWEHIRDIVMKAGSNILRMAGIFTCYCCNDNEINSFVLKKAMHLMDWYLEEASAIFYPMSERCQFEKDACELYAWIMTRIRQNNWCAIRKTDIERYGPNRLRRAEKLTPVLNQLIVQDYFCIIKMRSHQALYVSVRNNNGYILPFGAKPCEPFDVVPSLYSHNTKTYPVNIPPALTQPFAPHFSAYTLF
ncbi:YfjI family protein [Escherichia coli]|uniref:YfjI family protein n=2 Tax=Escherichia coli TaxID=562 RepID=UPI0032DB21AC